MNVRESACAEHLPCLSRVSLKQGLKVNRLATAGNAGGKWHRRRVAARSGVSVAVSGAERLGWAPAHPWRMSTQQRPDPTSAAERWRKKAREGASVGVPRLAVFRGVVLSRGSEIRHVLAPGSVTGGFRTRLNRLCSQNKGCRSHHHESRRERCGVLALTELETSAQDPGFVFHGVFVLTHSQPECSDGNDSKNVDIRSLHALH
jgi:hypothetical protein